MRILSKKGEIGLPVCFRDKVTKLPLKNLGNLAFFQFYPYFSTCPSLKSDSPTPLKSYFGLRKDGFVSFV